MLMLMIRKEDEGSFVPEYEATRPLELISLDGEVILRQYTPADAEEGFALIDRNRDHLSQFGDETAVKYPTLESFQESILRPKNPRRLHFGIRNRDDVLVGSINLTPQQKNRRKGKIGYYQGAEFQGKGYTTRAVETLTDYAFDQGGFEVLYGDVASGNIASERVLMMAGYIDYEGLKGKTRFFAYKDYLKGKKPNSEGGNYLQRANQDAELPAIAASSLQILGEQELNELLRIHQRFERPSNFVPESWEESRLRNLKGILRRLPVYQEASQAAQLPKEQSQDLLFTLLSASKYDFERDELNIELLNRTLHQMADKGTEIAPQDLRRIKTMIRLGEKDGIISTYLYSLGLAQRVGLSIQDSTLIISHFSVDDVWVHPGYATAPFVEALKALKVADINPKSVKQVFGQIERLPRHERGEAYQLLEHAITFACPSRRITPQELFDAYSTHGVEGETIADFLTRFIQEDNGKMIGEQGVQIITPGESGDKYFVPKEGRLEHAALPYRVQRSLDEGIVDLQELAKARVHLWEDVAEGFWTFNPKTSTWYSFGGKTEVGADKVRHEMLPYDISELTDQPYLFHVHPEDLEIMLRNPYDDFPSREYRNHATKFLSSTPSRADYALVAKLVKNAKYGMQAPRSFIAHSLGITESIYPSDVEALEKMAVESRDIRDEAMLNFRWRDIMRRLFTVDELTVVRGLIDELNNCLPDGFAVKLYSDTSEIKE